MKDLNIERALRDRHVKHKVHNGKNHDLQALHSSLRPSFEPSKGRLRFLKLPQDSISPSL